MSGRILIVDDDEDILRALGTSLTRAGFQVTSPRDPAQRGGTVTVAHEQAAAITRELVRREFIVDYRPGAGVRISPHFYTKDEELELVIAEMKKIRDSNAYQGEKVGAAF